MTRSPSLARRSLALAAAAAVGAGALLTAGSGPVAAETGNHEFGASPEPGVTVTGTGLVAGAPDVLRVSLAVQKRAPDVSTAIEAVNAGAKRIRAALAKRGVAASDVTTSDFSVSTPYQQGNADPGFEAVHALSVTLRDLATAGQTIADAARAGGNATRIWSTTYDIADRAALLEKARAAAFADAKAKAEAYATLSGRTLGTVRSVHEGNQDYGYYGGGAELGGLSGGLSAPSAVPFAPGTRNVAVGTTVVWSLL